MNGKEFVELTVKIPKPIFEFLFDTEIDVEKHIVQIVVEAVYSDVESGLSKLIMKKYSLEPVFKEYGVLPLTK